MLPEARHPDLTSPVVPASAPAEPLALLPGAVVLRRGDGLVQVAAGTRTAVVADTPQVRRLLDDLRTGGDDPAARPRSSDERAALAQLTERELLLPLTTLLAATRPDARRTTDPGALSALVATDPAGALDRRQARVVRRWSVEAYAGATAWSDDLRSLLVAAGVRTAALAHRRRNDDDHAEAEGVVVLTLGEPDRAHSDRLVRAGTPHLWVAVLPDHVRVGPFTVAGTTACLRCRDAGVAERDPRLLVALAQPSAGATATAPPPADPVLAALAVASAAHDVVRFADGGRPTTWSATTEVPLDGDVRQRTWPRHPWCGCSWDASRPEAVLPP